MKGSTTPWTVILSALATAMLSAWLVLGQGWSPWKSFGLAFLLVEGITMALLAGLLITADRNDRPALLRAFVAAIKKDLHRVIPFR